MRLSIATAVLLALATPAFADTLTEVTTKGIILSVQGMEIVRSILFIGRREAQDVLERSFHHQQTFAASGCLSDGSEEHGDAAALEVERQFVDPFPERRGRELSAGNAQDHVFAPGEGSTNGLARGTVRIDQRGGPCSEERVLLGQGHGVIRTDAE